MAAALRSLPVGGSTGFTGSKRLLVWRWAIGLTSELTPSPTPTHKPLLNSWTPTRRICSSVFTARYRRDYGRDALRHYRWGRHPQRRNGIQAELLLNTRCA